MPNDADRAEPLSPWHLPAVVAGNALEFYDFLTFAFFAVHIAHTFFPSSTPAAGLLKTLATFGAGFVTRPLGGWVLGHFADRHGRKPAMTLSFGLMGASILGMALTPSAARLGVLAPVLMLGFRLVEGFALGGEVGPATAFLAEAGPARWRGLVISTQSASQNVAILISSGIGLLLTWLLSAAQLDAFGWRIAFLVGAAVVPLGLWIRLSLPETLNRREAEPREKRRSFGLLMVLGGLLLLGATVQSYVQNYLTTYAIDSLHMNEKLAFLSTVIGAVVSAVVGPVCAAWSDRIGRRRPLLIWPAAIRLVATVPIFFVMVRGHSAVALLGGAVVLNALGAATPTAVAVVESIPRHTRATGFGVVYALVISVFGGTTQFVVQALIDWTKNPLAPAWYLTGALALGLVAAVAFPETAPRSIDG